VLADGFELHILQLLGSDPVLCVFRESDHLENGV
jgi:hypothetical protein